MGHPSPREYQNSQEKLCVKVLVLSLILAVIFSCLVLLLADSADKNSYDQIKNNDNSAEMFDVDSEEDSVWTRVLRISDLIPLKSRKKRFLTKVAEDLKIVKPGTTKPSKNEDKKSKKPKEKKSKSKPTVPAAPSSPKQSNPLANMFSPVMGGSILQVDKPTDNLKTAEEANEPKKEKTDKPATTVATTKKPEKQSEKPSGKPVVITIITPKSVTEQKITTAAPVTNNPAINSANSATIREHVDPMPTQPSSNHKIITPEQPVQKQEAENEKPKVTSEPMDEEVSEEASSKETAITIARNDTAPSNNELGNGQANHNQSSDDKNQVSNSPKNAEDSDLVDNSISGDPHGHPPISAPALDSEIHLRHQNIPEPGKLPFTIWSPNQNFHFHRFTNNEGVSSDSESSSSSEENKNLTNPSDKIYHFHRFENNETSAEFNGTSSSSEEVEDEVEKVIRESEHDTKPHQ